ncbi:MAG: hypothetical protein ACI4M6_00315, partial [Christensenellaceae bacterium]
NLVKNVLKCDIFSKKFQKHIENRDFLCYNTGTFGNNPKIEEEKNEQERVYQKVRRQTGHHH